MIMITSFLFFKLLTANNSTKNQIHPSGMYVTLAMEPRFHVKVQCLNNKNNSIAKVTSFLEACIKIQYVQFPKMWLGAVFCHPQRSVSLWNKSAIKKNRFIIQVVQKSTSNIISI